jgi:hypothetical protein
MNCLDNELEMLEEEIKENIEWLGTSSRDEIECISVENLEAVLTRFFGRKISLTLG